MTRFSYSQIHMGVRVVITGFATEGVAVEGCRLAFGRVAELDGVLSDYLPASELNLFCDQAGGGPQRISEDLFVVLERAQELAMLSGGAFDVTCGSLSILWRETRSKGTYPTPQSIGGALRNVGFRNLVLDQGCRTAELKVGSRLDLGGIGKGYACDQALATLRNFGIQSAMVEAGGDIAVSGPPPGREGWLIEIQGLVGEPLVLRDCAISTSGDSEQFLEVDGVRYSHLFDPRTGRALENQVQVTVIARDALTSDGLTKVCAILGPEASFPILERYGAKALLWPSSESCPSLQGGV